MLINRFITYCVTDISIQFAYLEVLVDLLVQLVQLVQLVPVVLGGLG